MLLIEDESACVPIAPPPPIKPVEQVSFPIGKEFVKKKVEETGIDDPKTPEEYAKDEEEKGAVYGPSYPKYGRYHKVFTKYPITVKNLGELLEPPIPDWSAVGGTNCEMFRPHFMYEMKESLEPHMYWIRPDCEQEYSPDPEFKMPEQLAYPVCIVKGKRGVLSLDFNVYKKIYIVLVFNAEEMAPHEALIHASRILPGEALVYSEPGMYKPHASLQVYLFYKEEEIHDGIKEFKPEEICVGFNEPNLDKALKDMNIIKMRQIQNTLYEFVFMHIWTHFFVDTWQCTPDCVHTNNLVLGMKYCYFDKFKTISFSIGHMNMSQQNLYNFEYWIVNNATVCLEHLGKLNLKWKSTKSVTFKALCDVFTYEAAGVETRLKRKQMTQEEWDAMMEKLCKKNDKGSKGGTQEKNS